MAKYALISCEDNNAEAYRQMLVEAGHNVIYEDEWFIVLLNKESEE